MKRLTKYKDGKFLLNHSSMNEAIDKLGKMEIFYEIGTNRVYYVKHDGEIYGNEIGRFNTFSLSEDGETIQIHSLDGFKKVLDFKDYKKSWSLKAEDLEDEIR